MRKKVLIYWLLFLVFFPPVFSLAQEENQQGITREEDEKIPSLPGNNDLESCFVYYDYGKVKANLATEKNSYSPGETAKVQGTVVNGNNFPLVGVVLYAQLRRINDSGDFAQNGHFLVDRLTLLENLSFLPQETKSINYKFPISLLFPNGEYQLQYFIFSKNGFHYSGRPFLEEDNAGVSNFTIGEGGGAEVYFDPGSLTAAGEAHKIREFITEFPDQPMTLSVGIADSRENNSAIAAEIKIYSFDDSTESNLVRREEVLLRPFNNFLAQTTFTPPHAGAYIFLVQMETPLKSIFKYRFAVSGEISDKLQMNDLNVSNFPPAKGDRAYVCFHSPSNSYAPETRVELSILDSEKQVTETKTISGSFDSQVQAISLPMEKLAGSRDFWLKAEFWPDFEKGGIVLPEPPKTVEIHYSCDVFAQSVKDVDISFDEENLQLKTKLSNICGEEVRVGGLVEQLRIMREGEVVKEEYNLDPVKADLSLKDLPAGNYTAEVKSGEIDRKLDFLVAAESKKSSVAKQSIKHILTGMVIILLGIGAIVVYKKRKR